MECSGGFVWFALSRSCDEAVPQRTPGVFRRIALRGLLAAYRTELADMVGEAQYALGKASGDTLKNWISREIANSYQFISIRIKFRADDTDFVQPHVST